jgi:hypothetical protein
MSVSEGVVETCCRHLLLPPNSLSDMLLLRRKEVDDPHKDAEQ